MQNQVIFGIHSVEASVKDSNSAVSELVCLKDARNRKIELIIDLAKKKSIRTRFVSREELDKITHKENHQGIAAFTMKAKSYKETDLPELLDQETLPLVLVLDGVQDPHNLGACLRSCAAFGVAVVIAPKNNACSLTPAAIKVASGAAELVPFIQVSNLVRSLKDLKEMGYWMVGLDGLSPDPLNDIDLKGPTAIVMGAEGSGMRRLTRENCDFVAKIPMSGSIESLNVSVAAGVALYEASRQRT